MTSGRPDDDVRVERLLRPLLGVEPVTRRLRTRRRHRLVATAAVVVLALVAGATFAGAMVGIGPLEGALTGPAAPREKQEAMRDLFPPLKIGPARTLAEYGGRTLFGARTARGGYCFSATSPVDPNAEGGHCVSREEARRLDSRGTVAFAMSGWSVGGYAPGATTVRITGAGLRVTVPVNERGWWIGVARLPDPPLPDGVDEAIVIATAFAGDGRPLAADALFHIRRVKGLAGDVFSISLV